MKISRFNFATVIFAAGFVVAVTLVTVLLRNPATHSNLEDPEHYDRTRLVYLGEEYPYDGFGARTGSLPAGSDPHDAGGQLYLRRGCASCHGLYGEGATVGPELWSIGNDEVGDVVNDLRNPPLGMPHYPSSVLTDAQIEEIIAHIGFARADGAALGITARVPPTTPETVPDVTDGTPGDPGEEAAPTTEPPAPPIQRELAAPIAAITVDGDTSDWDGIADLELTLEAIVEEDAPARDASIRVAHDDEFIYLLFTVDDDFNWSDVDPHFSGAPAVMWPVEEAAGPHMGGEELSGHPALGMVDIWYWRLDCPIGVEQGGAVSGPGTGDPGNDAACNFDDEWATDPETHDDDVGPGAENSLLGVFSHSNPVEDGDGTWYFEMRRPLQTGDPMDAQFVVGETTRLALAYWDPDAGQNGWGRRNHVQSSNQGWIDVVLAG